MVNEQDKTLEALQTAIQMEIEGKKYYLKASQKSENVLGRKLLQSLAAEEDVHQNEFKKIYEAIRRNKAWPISDFQPAGGKNLRTVFARTIETARSDVKASSSEIDSVQIAIDMENKTHEFYKSRSKIASYSTEKAFYDTLASEEREHYLILLDYYEYLKDPAGWFVKQEHPTLDGG